MGLSFESDRNVMVSELNEMAVSSGLVAYYTCDALNGTTLIDNSGNNNNGTNYGATLTTGINGNALSFNGTSNYVTIPSSSLLTLGLNGTISAWIKSIALTATLQMIVDHYVSGYGYSIFLNSTGLLSARFGSDASADLSSTNYSDNTWHHVLITSSSSGNYFRVYIDSVQRYSNVAPTIYSATDGETVIGNRITSNFYFNGLIDEVRIYNRALSAAEVKQLYKLNAPNNVASMKEE